MVEASGYGTFGLIFLTFSARFREKYLTIKPVATPFAPPPPPPPPLNHISVLPLCSWSEFGNGVSDYEGTFTNTCVPKALLYSKTGITWQARELYCSFLFLVTKSLPIGFVSFFFFFCKIKFLDNLFLLNWN